MGTIKQNEMVQSDLLQLVSFTVGKEIFAIDILLVKEIIRPVKITEIPNTPHFIEGIINLRGNIITVINLREKLGLPDKEDDNNTRVIVVEINERIIGFIVDSVEEVVRISSSITEAPPDSLNIIDTEYIKSVGKLDDKLLILIDLEKIINTNK